MRRPGRLAVEVHLPAARADVEVDGQAELLAGVEERGPGRLGEVGQPGVLGVRTGDDPAQAHGRASAHLVQRGVHVPPRHERHREDPLARCLLELGAGVVVDLRARQPEGGVVHTEERLVAEPGDVGVHDLGVDPEVVHHLQPGRDLRRRVVHLLDGDLHPADAVDLRAVAVDDARRTGAADVDVVADDPAHAPVDRLLARHEVPVPGRGPRRPQVGRFGQVGVDVDDLDAGEHVVGRCRLGSHGVLGSPARPTRTIVYRRAGSAPPRKSATASQQYRATTER